MKFIHNQQPVGVHLAHQADPTIVDDTTDKCPCCRTCSEDQIHLILCQSNPTKQRRSGISKRPYIRRPSTPSIIYSVMGFSNGSCWASFPSPEGLGSLQISTTHALTDPGHSGRTDSHWLASRNQRFS